MVGITFTHQDCCRRSPSKAVVLTWEPILDVAMWWFCREKFINSFYRWGNSAFERMSSLSSFTQLGFVPRVIFKVMRFPFEYRFIGWEPWLSTPPPFRISFLLYFTHMPTIWRFSCMLHMYLHAKVIFYLRSHNAQWVLTFQSSGDQIFLDRTSCWLSQLLMDWEQLSKACLSLVIWLSLGLLL